jgi:diamine N-acetyltransferase
MIIYLKNSLPVNIRLINHSDEIKLLHYLNGLSPQTKTYFGPHAFDQETVSFICHDFSDEYIRVVAETTNGQNIIAYAIIKNGFLQHDAARLMGYDLQLNAHTDCTFAPSVADEWQGTGIGAAMLTFIIPMLQQQNKQRIILWGGVQCSNEKAIAFYKKYDFTVLGSFEYNGMNYDMIKCIAERGD